MTPRITAVICTHNRAGYLGRAIASLLDQDVDPACCEILVIDNASTDDTRAVVEAAGPRVRCIREDVLGLSHARNAGFRHARASWVALLDDDAVAGRGWLRAILDATTSVRPEPGCIGGPIRAIWEAPRPEWLSDALLAGLSILDWTDTAHPIEDIAREWLAGANLAVRKDLLEEVGGFVHDLDRVGTRMLSSGDVFLQKQILARGRSVWYDPRVEVAHHIPAARLDRRWFRRRYYAQGLSDARMRLLEERLTGRRRLLAGLRAAAGVAASGRDWRALLGPSDDPDAFTAHCFTLIRVGQVTGLLGAA